MRRLLIPFVAVVLLGAACGDDDGGIIPTTTTAAGTTVSVTTTTEGETTTTGAGPVADKPRDTASPSDIPRDDKRDPGGLKLQAMTKAVGADRSANAAAHLEQVLAAQMEARERGDDPYLDELWDLCAAGDMAACDELYRLAPVGSDYEAFGDTCGGRTEGGTWCVDIGQVEGPNTYGDDPYFDGLWDDCAAGIWAACDTLYLETPVGSAYEAFGETCGDTTDGLEWCVDVYGSDDASMAVLYDACAAGDWQACDDLYVIAPVGSDEEEFGFTCGGLTDGLRWCVDEFGGGGAGAGYGDDPYLDGLWDDCALGDMAACDALYLDSPVGSEYETFGFTCGDRTDGSEWCSDAVIDDAYGYGGDPYLDALWDSCALGDWYACDDLYMQSPVGSEYEDFGGTCGWTTDGVDWCTDVYEGGGIAVYTYGDDPYFDALWDSCALGDWQACDDLYMESPVGSEYEDFGGTCGWTTDGVDWCTDVYVGYDVGGAEPYTYGDDPYFDALWDSCALGDWEACDTLYAESPIGSEYEDFGNTCGWTTDGTMWCTDVYVTY